MDDIDDILASVSVPSVPQRTRDTQALTRAWVNERTSPELLPYPASLVERVTDRIKQQVRKDDVLSYAKADRSQCRKSNFTLVILQTELERFKFLVRSFLRARIAKVGLETLLTVRYC
jgi:GINS complex subunit 4